MQETVSNFEERITALRTELEDAKAAAAHAKASGNVDIPFTPQKPSSSSSRAPSPRVADVTTPDLRAELAEEQRMFRDLEDEHEDLLALLAQQELEKNAIRDKLLETAGEDAYEMARKVAERQCLSRFGIYVPEYTSPMKSDDVTEGLETDTNDTENGDMFLSLSPAARARAKYISGGGNGGGGLELVPEYDEELEDL